MKLLKDLKVNDEIYIKTEYSEDWTKVLEVDDNKIFVSGHRTFDKNTGKPIKAMGYHAEITDVRKR